VTLREFRSDDAQLVASVIDDPLIPLITSVPTVQDEAEIQAYLERQPRRASDGWGLSFAVVDDATGRAVGQASLRYADTDDGRASLGYWVAPVHRRKGFARAALSTLADWAENHLHIQRLELYVEPWNEGSWRTAEAAGFTRDGLMRQWERVGHQRRDMYMYSRITSIDAGEWEA
jgi:RimJ/RimL family protein N-acetyltransferase